MKTSVLYRTHGWLAGLLFVGAGGPIALTGAEFKEEIHQTHPLVR
jgi:hypothetical protein